MTAIRGRKSRSFSHRPNPVLLQARIDPTVREKANTAASAAGISMADYVEQLIARDIVDAQGCPLWLPARNAPQEEPLKTA